MNGFPYLGKDDERPDKERLSDYVVMKVMSPYLRKGRNVTTDNYFTSKLLAEKLKAQGTSLVGTLNKIRREVPKEVRKTKKTLHSSQIYKSKEMTLTVYQGKEKKNVLVLSTTNKFCNKNLTNKLLKYKITNKDLKQNKSRQKSNKKCSQMSK